MQIEDKPTRNIGIISIFLCAYSFFGNVLLVLNSVLRKLFSQGIFQLLHVRPKVRVICLRNTGNSKLQWDLTQRKITKKKLHLHTL